MAEIIQITNANVYLDGNNLLGMVEEVTIPEIMVKMSEYMGMGMVGSFELPVGFDKVDVKMKFKSYVTRMMRKLGNPFQTIQLQFRANLESWDTGGRKAQDAFITTMRVNMKKLPTGTTYKQNARAEFTGEASVLYFKQEVAGEVIIELDFVNSIFKVNGEDMLTDYRANLGM